MRSTWSGNLTIGGFAFPIRLYTASKESKIGFNQCHKEDKGRVRYLKVCSVCQKPLSGDDICKGYEVAGQMLTFTEEEIEKLKPMTNGQMAVKGFVDRNAIPDILLDVPYFIGTGKVDMTKASQVATPFKSFQKALVKTGKVAVVSWVSRTTENLGLLAPYGNGFLLKRLLYADEVRSMEEVEVLDASVPAEAVDMLSTVIQKLTIPFDHNQYHETASEGIRKLIEARANGEDIPIEAQPVATPSWMDALKAMATA